MELSLELGEAGFEVEKYHAANCLEKHFMRVKDEDAFCRYTDHCFTEWIVDDEMHWALSRFSAVKLLIELHLPRKHFLIIP
ncbi:hypothetical protein KFK09_019168 [Dendrobium nobile]|uniref:Uncharacterized protein n=1 Tax=Dendrobium nobile TaxID=94219 RepID=A0A8T3AXU8_DENNO|nr:hypothetical protein KFK09_019168 [Dendrobium nobile]